MRNGFPAEYDKIGKSFTREQKNRNEYFRNLLVPKKRFRIQLKLSKQKRQDKTEVINLKKEQEKN